MALRPTRNSSSAHPTSTTNSNLNAAMAGASTALSPNSSASGSESSTGSSSPAGRHYGTRGPGAEDRREEALDELRWRRERQRRFLEKGAGERQFTFRAVVVGLLVGSLVCFSNMYFGLQSEFSFPSGWSLGMELMAVAGWVSMMSMPSTLIGFAIFKALGKHLSYAFTPVENVLVQTVAVAVGSMPLAAGFVGVIPALEKLLLPKEGGPISLSTWELVLWSVGLAFFGVVFAVPCKSLCFSIQGSVLMKTVRKQVIIKEKLKFPSGTATALMISVLHGTAEKTTTTTSGEYQPLSTGDPEIEDPDLASREDAGQWKTRTKSLIYAFGFSGAFTLLSYFIPILRDLPIFGSTAASIWLWTLNPSPAYIGQGVIMGFETTMHMLLGAVVGWGILSPMAKWNGWAPGETGDWKEGSRGWIVWVSLSVMLSDSLVSLGLIILDSIREYVGRKDGIVEEVVISSDASARSGRKDSQEDRGSELRRRTSSLPVEAGIDLASLPEPDSPPSHLVPNKVVYIGFALSALLCISTISLLFPQTPLYASLSAFILALLLSVMGVRALGQTDLNPVSGISKLTQLVFAIIVPKSNPNAILINLIAGAVSEAGAMQAGDLMQDLKTGHLLGAAPRAQFYGQLIGALFGSLISAGIYRLYTSVYTIPSALFQIPSAYIWLDCSRLVFGAGLPPKAWAFSWCFGILFAITTYLKARTFKHHWVGKWIPGGIAVAVGMYNAPSFTLARAVGGCLMGWVGWKGRGKETEVVILASGLILGEGIFSIVNLGLASFGVGHL